MPALTPVYDDTLSRVRLVATALGSAADTARFEHSVDEVHWATVRGGDAVPVVSGAASVDHWEFAPGVANYYRVAAVDTAAITFVAAGVAATAVNGSVVPALPAGITEGDLLVTWAAIRNSGTGTINTPAGWVELLASGNAALLGRRATAAEAAPTVTVSGGVAGADVIAQMAAFRNAELVPAAWAAQLNPAGQDIDFPPLHTVPTGALILYLGWKQDDWTSVAAIAGATEIGETASIAGDDAGLVWDYAIQTTTTAVPAGVFAVTGGAAGLSRGAVAAVRVADHVTLTTAAIAPALDSVWLKFPAAPYCNRKVTLTDWTEIGRNARAGVFEVVGARHPVVVSDLHTPLEVAIFLHCTTDEETAALDLVLSLGIGVLLHVPPTCALPSMHAAIGNYEYRRPAARSHHTRFRIPLTETGAPGFGVVGALGTWVTVVNRYATWQAVLDANATWQAVLDLIGDPTDAVWEA